MIYEYFPEILIATWFFADAFNAFRTNRETRRLCDREGISYTISYLREKSRKLDFPITYMEVNQLLRDYKREIGID